MSFRTSRFPIRHDAPIQRIHTLLLNGSASATFGSAAAGGKITNANTQDIKAGDARLLGLMYTITAATGAGTVVFNVQMNDGKSTIYYTHQGEGNGIDNGSEVLTYANGNRFVWYRITTPIVRIRITTASMGANEDFILKAVRAVLQS